MARFKKFIPVSFLDLSEEVFSPKVVVRGNLNGFFLLFQALNAAINQLNEMKLIDQKLILQLESFKNGINTYLGFEPYIEQKEDPRLTTETIGPKNEKPPFGIVSLDLDVVALLLNKDEVNAMLSPLLTVQADEMYKTLSEYEPQSFQYIESLVTSLQTCLSELESIDENIIR